MRQIDTDIDFGKIRLDADASELLPAFRLIRATDPNLFAEMAAQDWHIVSCETELVECFRMIADGSMATTGGKDNEHRNTTIVLWEAIAGDINSYWLLRGVKIPVLHAVAATLAHEFVHLFPGIGDGELGPETCALRFAELLGDTGLIQYYTERVNLQKSSKSLLQIERVKYGAKS